MFHTLLFLYIRREQHTLIGWHFYSRYYFSNIVHIFVNAQDKCELYWPDKIGEYQGFGEMQVKMDSESDGAEQIVTRAFQIKPSSVRSWLALP